MTNRFIAAHEPRIILITPPPINEYKIEDGDRERGFVEASRTVEHTRAYATACRGIGEELDVPVLDLWSIMMAKAGWKEGDKLLGSRDAPRNEVLDNLLSDGESRIEVRLYQRQLIYRTAFLASSIQASIRVIDGIDCGEVARSDSRAYSVPISCLDRCANVSLIAQNRCPKIIVE